MSTVHPRLTHARHLRGANGCEARGDEYVMRPIHAGVMDVVLAVAQQRDTVDDGTRIGGKRSLGRLARRGSADDCALTLTPVRWDLTDLLSVGRSALLERDHRARCCARTELVADDDL